MKTRWDDTLGEFTGDGPCTACRLNHLITGVAS